MSRKKSIIRPKSRPENASGNDTIIDDGILHAAQKGDRKAFVEIVRRYEQTVYSFAFKVCRYRDKAAETLQDTFVNVFRKLHQFDGKSKFTTWLYSIVANNCMMKHRRSKIDEAAMSLNDLPPHGEGNGTHSHPPIPAWKQTPLDGIMRQELRTLLDKAIEQLPLDYRAVFIMRDVEGHSAEETARVLRLSIPAVKSRLRRARVFLRNQLSGYMTS
jgi:RNA polymerase sigma-70 factor, ECF subfamily